MGEMADLAIDNACAELEHFNRYQDCSIAEQYEEGLVDEHGVTIGDPTVIPAIYKYNQTWNLPAVLDGDNIWDGT